jgi:putative hemolysin
MSILADLSLLLALVAFNGVFAMAEVAILSARRVRLAQLAERPVRGAARALALSRDPTRFLSTIQAGMTSIGILSGAAGEATLVVHIRSMVERLPLLAPYAEPVSLAVMVMGLTYVSIIVGELIPKRLALASPERIAARVAPFIHALSRVASPLVHVLGVSTEFALRLLGVAQTRPPAVSLEELKGLIDQGLVDRTNELYSGHAILRDGSA